MSDPDLATDEDWREGQDWLNTFEWLFRKGYFGAASIVLDGVEVETISTHELMVILTITWHAKEHLPRRDKFVQRAELVLANRLGDERTQKLMRFRR